MNNSNYNPSHQQFSILSIQHNKRKSTVNQGDCAPDSEDSDEPEKLGSDIREVLMRENNLYYSKKKIAE